MFVMNLIWLGGNNITVADRLPNFFLLHSIVYLAYSMQIQTLRFFAKPDMLKKERFDKHLKFLYATILCLIALKKTSKKIFLSLFLIFDHYLFLIVLLIMSQYLIFHIYSNLKPRNLKS